MQMCCLARRSALQESVSFHWRAGDRKAAPQTIEAATRMTPFVDRADHFRDFPKEQPWPKISAYGIFDETPVGGG